MGKILKELLANFLVDFSANFKIIFGVKLFRRVALARLERVFAAF